MALCLSRGTLRDSPFQVLYPSTLRPTLLIFIIPGLGCSPTLPCWLWFFASFSFRLIFHPEIWVWQFIHWVLVLLRFTLRYVLQGFDTWDFIYLHYTPVAHSCTFRSILFVLWSIDAFVSYLTEAFVYDLFRRRHSRVLPNCELLISFKRSDLNTTISCRLPFVGC